MKTRTSNRKGISLIEIMVAVVILGGPMIYCITGVINSTRSTGRHLDRATAQLMLTDFAEWVMAKSHVRPRMLARFGKEELLARWMEAQYDMDAPQKIQVERNMTEILDRMYIELVKAPEGRKGLCLVTIHATLMDGTHLSVPVLLRGLPHGRKGRRGGPGGPGGPGGGGSGGGEAGAGGPQA